MHPDSHFSNQQTRAVHSGLRLANILHCLPCFQLANPFRRLQCLQSANVLRLLRCLRLAKSFAVLPNGGACLGPPIHSGGACLGLTVPSGSCFIYGSGRPSGGSPALHNASSCDPALLDASSGLPELPITSCSVPRRLLWSPSASLGLKIEL